MNQPTKSPKVFIWLLTLTACSGNVGNTIISPALGPISKYFGIDEASSQALLSAYYLPMALFPLVFGSLSDRYGRRPPLIFGLAILTTGLKPTISKVGPSNQSSDQTAILLSPTKN